MADAKKCDRCKKFYDMYGGIPFYDSSNMHYNCIELRYNSSSMYCRFELCEDCQKALYSFLKKTYLIERKKVSE